MRLPSMLVALAFSFAAAAPCLAQGMEVRAGAPVRIEVAHVDAVVDEGVARVEVDETFRNLTDAVQEGVWRFKLPEDAVIGSFSMWMEGREKQGRVLEAVQARRIYDSIVRTKRDPGLLEQTGWREFRVNVFPIPAKDTVRVRLVYSHVVRDELGLETLEVALPQGAGAIGDLRVHATVRSSHGISGIDCPSNADAKVIADANCGEVTWGGDGVEPKRAFVIRSIPRRTGFDVTVLASRPAGSDEGWFVARVVPKLDAPPVIPRDVVFVIDRSGSMEGRKIEQARAALLRGLGTLKSGDRFDVVSFSSDVTSLGEGRMMPATEESVERAKRAVRDISAGGGTNIDGALEAALAERAEEPGRLGAVVFLTDGDATVGETNPDRILAGWSRRSGPTRLYALGVGADVKDFLLTKLAVLGRGDAQYVRDEDALEVRLSALFDRVKTPLLLDPSVEISGEGVEILDREPRRLPDVFQGRALVVAGRYKGAGKATLRLTGHAGASEVKLDVPVELPAETPPRPFLAQIWAKARIERLLDELHIAGGGAEIRDQVRRLALRHQLVTPFTSFLVVEDGVKLPGDETARLPGGDAAVPATPPVADAPPEVIPRDAVPGPQSGPVNPDDAVVADTDAGEFNPDPAAPPGATGGTSIGVGRVGHYGTGSPSSFTSRAAGAGGRGGGGLGQGGGGGAGGATKQTETSVMWALRWLKNHQSPDGRWDSDGFDAQCKLNRCDGVGDTTGDVGATGLALLPFLGAGETHQSGTCRETVKSGLKWLRDIQDSDGCFGPRTGPRFLRDHAIAALAVTEAYGMTSSRVFKEPAQRAIAFALLMRTPLSGWHGNGPGDGALDVETTGWMVMLLRSARMAGLDVDVAAFKDTVAALDTVTDRTTGRVGGSDASTAIGVLVRILAGDTPKDDEMIVKGADLLRARLPNWDTAAGAIDLTYWHFATLAMYQVGNGFGGHWKSWNEAMRTAVIDHQHLEADRDARGSWDPLGAGAAEGGRIRATALAALDMEVYYRYARVLGVRPADPPPPGADPAPAPDPARPAGK